MFGFESTQYSDVVLKSKLIASNNDNPIVQAVLKNKLTDNLHVIVSTKFDLVKFKTTNDCDFGLGLEYTGRST